MSAHQHSLQKHKAVQQLAFNKILHGLQQIYNWPQTLVAATGRALTPVRLNATNSYAQHPRDILCRTED